MKLKRIYRYLGDGDLDLNDRATARCPSCCPPDLPVVPASLVAGTANKSSVILDAQGLRCCPIDATHFLIVYYQMNAPHNLKGVVVTINSDLTVTYGTAVTIHAFDSRSNIDVRLLDTNKIILIHSENIAPFKSYARVLTISGTTFTVGAVNDLSENGWSGSPKIAVMSPTACIHTYAVSSSVRTRVLTISGDTVTEEVETILTGTPANPTASGDLTKISSNRALLVHGGQGFGNCITVLTMSGTAMAFGAYFNIDTAGFQGPDTETFKMTVSPSGSLGLITTRSVFEAPNFVMARTLPIAGDTVTSDSNSEHIATITNFGGGNRVWNATLTETVGVILSMENDITNRRLFAESINYNSADISTRLGPTLVSSFLSEGPHMVKVRNNLVAWAAYNGASGGALLAGVIKVT